MLNIVSTKKDHTLGIRIDDELLETLERLAKADDRSVSAMARLLIVEALRARGSVK